MQIGIFILIFGVGAVMGLFLKPHIVAILVAALGVAAVASLFVGSWVGNEGAAMGGGVFFMMLIVLAPVVIGGAYAGRWLRDTFIRLDNE